MPQEPLGLGGSINPQFPERRGWVCCTSDLGLIPAKLASQHGQWQETDTSPGYLSSQFLSKERNTLKTMGVSEALRKALSLWAGERGNSYISTVFLLFNRSNKNLQRNGLFHSIDATGSFYIDFFFFLATLSGLQDFRSLIRDWTWAIPVKARILTTKPPVNSLHRLFWLTRQFAPGAAVTDWSLLLYLRFDGFVLIP